MKLKYRRLWVVLGVLVVVVAAGCSSDKTVGEDLQTDLNEAINELSTTSVPQESTTTAVVASPGETTAPTQAQTTVTTAPRGTTTLPPDRVVVVTINADTSGRSQFEPVNAQARIGTPVVFRNQDKEMRYVTFPNDNLRSPDLQPGQEWTYKPTKTGTFALKDGTRPYVNGSLQVY